MLGKLKRAFIPHKHNGYRPHAIRHKWLNIYTLGLIISHFAFGIAFYTGPINTNEAVFARSIINLTNKSRKQIGEKALIENKALTDSAYAKLTHMFQNNYWDHKAPDGTEAWYFIKENNYKYTIAGENLAKGFSNASSAFNAWMASPTHRSNILDKRYRDIGVAVGTGKINNKKTTIIVQLFGSTKPYSGEPQTVLTLGEKTRVPSFSLRNATSPKNVPYFALWALILSFVVFDFVMLKKEGLHKNKRHRLHFNTAIILSSFLFLILAVSIASIA